MNIIFSLIQNLLPATCLSLFCIVSALDRKKSHNKAMMILLAVFTVCFTIDSAINLGAADPSFEIMSVSFAIMGAPLVWMFLHMYRDSANDLPISRMVSLLAPFALFVGIILLFFLTPIAGKYLHSANETGKLISLIISCLFVVESAYILYYTLTSQKETGKSYKLIANLFFALFLFLTVRLFIKTEPVNVVFNLIVTGLLLMICSTVLKQDYSEAAQVAPVSAPEVEIPDDQAADQDIEELDETDEDIDTEEQGDAVEGSVRPVIPLTEAAEDSLRAKFEDFIIGQQSFLRPGLTMGDVAKELKTNRTYVSQLVNKTYNMSFPEFLNSLRIDFAEQFILHNRGASQQEVARACGFPSASSFNVTFKKITGVTPRIWLATYRENNQ